MIRKIIRMDEGKCNGCGACAAACHEGAIGMVNGKAKLLREDYCDGLGDCLPACPMDAISFEEREAPAYDEAAVMRSKAEKENKPVLKASEGRLENWPVQIKLAPVNAPCFQDADLLIAADCTAFSYGNFHEEFMRGRTTLIACPKLDAVDYSIKLQQIFAENNIHSITLVRMQVPCCGGLEFAVRRALMVCGKNIPVHTIVISTDGRIVNS